MTNMERFRTLSILGAAVALSLAMVVLFVACGLAELLGGGLRVTHAWVNVFTLSPIGSAQAWLEGLRFLEASAVDIAGGTSQLAIWLSHVFRVLGGYALAMGLLTIALAATSYRRREPLAIAGTVAAGASGIGLMVFANFAINSDFR